MAEKISITKGFSSTTFDTYVPELSDNADIQNAFELFYYGNSEDGNTTGDVSLHANLVDFDNRITANDSDISGHTGATLDVHGTGAGQSVVGTGTVQTITNKTINLASNTLTGTLAQFNTAITDADFATLAGTETLTAKTLTSPVITGGTVNGGVALTVTSTELNIMDGVTASTAELNIMDGVTASTAELNIMDGVTASTAELNIMDGVTASTAELNYVNGVTSEIQTQINTNTPTGMISIHAGATAPTGWLLCDGTSYASASYTTLFNVIGYTFGGSGANFNVPNLKGRIVVGIDIAQVEFNTRGEIGGSMTHQHVASNSGDSTPTTSVASAGNTTSGASTGNTTGGASAGNATGGATAGNTTSGISVNHSHVFDTPSDTSSAQSNNASNAVGSVSHSGYTHSLGYTTTPSNAHTHVVNPAAANTGTESADHSHNTADHGHYTDDHSHNTTDHTHTTTDHTHTALHSHTTPASSSLSNLQPYIALNYIIKI